MLSWRLEGSNDLVNWICLDVRQHEPDNGHAMSILCRPGATTTWGVDPTVCRRLGIVDGFNTFRLVQTSTNSEGGHHMSIGGLELYGTPTNPEQWQIVNRVY
jgi:hypothetical protein